MTSFATFDSLFYAPELLRPGVKPAETKIVRINRDHPAAPDFLIAVNQGCGAVRDLASNNQYALVNNGAWDRSTGEIGVKFLSNTDAINIGSIGQIGAFYVEMLWHQDNITSAISRNVMRLASNTFTNLFLGSFTGFLTDELIGIGDTGSGRTAYTSNTDTILGSRKNTFFFNWNGSNYDIYWNGEKKTATAGSSGHAALLTTSNVYWCTQDADATDKILGTTAFWNNPLPAGLAASVARDPYQYLEPVSTTAIFSVADAAGGFKAFWAKPKSKIIGTGNVSS